VGVAGGVSLYMIMSRPTKYLVLLPSPWTTSFEEDYQPSKCANHIKLSFILELSETDN
jgi:hypothetical protein